jgi:FkbM family methyltransferase
MRVNRAVKQLIKGVVSALHVSLPVRVGAQLFWIPTDNRLGYLLLSAGTREPGVTKVIERILAKRGGTVIDVGANVGQTLLAVKSVDPARPYLGFEPNPACCSYIGRLAQRNHLLHVGVVCCGLSVQCGLAGLQTRRGMPEVSSTTPGFRPNDFYDDVRLVPVLQGDAALAACGIEDIAVIKIDVEGGELEVLQGLKRTLARAKPPILFEVLPDHIFVTDEPLPKQLAEGRRHRAESVERELRGHGYLIGRICDDGSIQPIGSLVERQGTTLGECNYMAYAN